jgi:hypothetical protein
MAQSSLSPVLTRGVYRAPYRVKGAPTYVAVSANGDRIAELPVGALFDTPELCVVWLEGLLEHEDPIPHLEIVR